MTKIKLMFNHDTKKEAIQIDLSEIEETRNYICLGQLIQMDTNHFEDTKRRTGGKWAAFQKF